ncbi:MAG TPA: sigma-70 family RNA polymerase sigma factor [Candidatus Limnocylindrales bacterium]|nr:sigma-70 family RNA polymerase sigma factor [Candidatus Limnocylindrales bacterium]
MTIRVAGGQMAFERAGRDVVETLQRESGQAIFGFCRRLGLPDDEAEEVVQEALLRLWKVLARGDPIETPAAWAFRTAYRLSMDRHRWRRRFDAFVHRDRSTAMTPAHTIDDLLAVWTEVDRLPPRQRAVLYLRYRADMTFETIGEVLGIDAGSARSNASRAITTLRDRLVEGDR